MLPRLFSPRSPQGAELWLAESLQCPTLTDPTARGSSNALLLQFLYIWGKKPHLLPSGTRLQGKFVSEGSTSTSSKVCPTLNWRPTSGYESTPCIALSGPKRWLPPAPPPHWRRRSRKKMVWQVRTLNKFCPSLSLRKPVNLFTARKQHGRWARQHRNRIRQRKG